MPELFIYVQQEVLAMAHTAPCLPKRKSRAGKVVGNDHAGKRQKNYLHILNGETNLV
jgi:hypothetical protein